MAALRVALGDRYDSDATPTQDRIEAQVSVTDGTLATAARRTRHATFLQSASGHRLLGCRDGTLSVHTLAPYPGWESFLAQAQEAASALPPGVRDQPLRQLAVHYVDRIELPVAGGVGFQEYVTVMPRRPDRMPKDLSACYYATQTHDPETNVYSQLIVASMPPSQDGNPVLLYDLTLQQRGDPLCTFSEDAWAPIVEELHVRQRDIFEDSITDKMRELFQ